jgi:hypothetical protein
MWPYNYCEWKIITYGVGKTKSYWRKNRSLILMCTVPSVVLAWLLVLVI